MNIGDKVRALHEDIEGHISKFLPDGVIEVETADGFGFPLHKNELVMVSAQEAEAFGEDEIQKVEIKKPIKPKAEKGLYLIFEPLTGDKLVRMRVYNNTSQGILFALYEKSTGVYKKSTAGVIGSKNTADGTVFSLEDFDNWPSFVFQFNDLPDKTDTLPRVKQKEVKMKASVFFKSKTEATPIGTPGWSFQIDQSEVKINIDQLKDSLVNTSTPTKEAVAAVTEIDLHSEAIGLDAKLPKNDYLPLQLNAFEKALDNAIRASLNDITFIHGVGNGKLQFEIQKRLSNHPNVATFADARKEKFGYGATKAILK